MVWGTWDMRWATRRPSESSFGLSPRTLVASTGTRCSPLPRASLVSFRFYCMLFWGPALLYCFGLLTRFLLRGALHRAFRFVRAQQHACRSLGTWCWFTLGGRRSPPHSLRYPFHFISFFHLISVRTYAMVEPVEPVISPFAPAVSFEIRAVLLLLSLPLRSSCILCLPACVFRDVQYIQIPVSTLYISCSSHDP